MDEGDLKPNVITCRIAADVFRAIEKFQGDPYGWIFRGQRKAEWELIPSLERKVPLPIVSNAELNLMKDFQAKAHLYTNVLPQWEDVVSWLGAMQHYGIPTRLLDWTFSGYAALYFALDGDSGQDQDQDQAAIWIVNYGRLNSIARTKAKVFLNFLSAFALKSR